MSVKATRGTKHVCQNCGSKFYDLNREEIICPMCSTVLQYEQTNAKAALSGNSTEEEDDDELIVAVPGNVEIVSLEDADTESDDDIPDLEGGDLVDIEEDGADIGDDEETFIEVEDDDSGDDVTGIVVGARNEAED